MIVDQKAANREQVSRSAATAYSNEFDDYIERIRPITHFITDIKTWWLDAGFPHLRDIGIRLASCHGSSANTERVFSGLNRIVTSTRNALNIQTLFELMTIRIHRLSLDEVNKRGEVTMSSQTIRASQSSQPPPPPSSSDLATTSQASERSRSPASSDAGEESEEEDDLSDDHGVSILDTVELNEADQLIANASRNIHKGRALFMDMIDYSITSVQVEGDERDVEREEEEEVEEDDSFTRSRRLLGLL